MVFWDGAREKRGGVRGGGVKNKEWKGRGESTESIKSAVATMNCPESLEGDRERGEE